jgi:hypothetical protein
MSSAELSRSLDLLEIKPGKKFSVQVLKDLLPDVETVLFFGKVYELDHVQLSNLLAKVVNSPLTNALFGGSHSEDLQDYLLDIAYDAGVLNAEPLAFDAGVEPHGEILPQMWEQLEVEVATSIKAVAEKLDNVIGMLPGKQGNMVFKSMMQMNAKRPTMGVHKAAIEHAPQKRNLVVLDVSGSMTANTVRAIIEDVVAMSYKADAAFACVSNNTHYWEPGSYSVDDILAKSQFGGTHYETLEPLFDRDWGTVITVADYDSSLSAKQHLARTCVGKIDTLLDISLVNQTTFLAECLGQFASEVRPLLIGNSSAVLNR